MNMFVRFNENQAMTLQDIKETKRYGRTDGCTDGRTDGHTDGRTDNVKTVYPLQTKFAGGIINQRHYYYLSFYTDNQPQNSECRNNPENFHLCIVEKLLNLIVNYLQYLMHFFLKI